MILISYSLRESRVRFTKKNFLLRCKSNLMYLGDRILRCVYFSAIQCVTTKVAKSLNVDSEQLNDEALKIKNELLNKAKCFDKMIELLAAIVKRVESSKIKTQILTLAPYRLVTQKSHGCVWCSIKHCTQGLQIVLWKRHFNCAKTKKGKVFACWYWRVCRSILPRWSIYSTDVRQERLC